MRSQYAGNGTCLDNCCSGTARRYGGRGRAHSIEAPWAAPGQTKIEKDETVDFAEFRLLDKKIAQP